MSKTDRSKKTVRTRESAAAELGRMGYCIGSHLSVAGGLHHAAAEARVLGMQAVQVFVKNQRQWRAPPIQPDALDTWFAEMERGPLGPVVAHATYLINLASPVEASRVQSRDAFADELARCDAYKIPYLVVHPGAAVGASIDDATRRVSQSLNEIFESAPGVQAMPLLEFTAGQGSTLGRNTEEIAMMIGGVTQSHRIGVCIDTCHIFAAGIDIRDAEKYAAFITEIERTIGLDRVRCWHLNDSRGSLGSHVDRHEHIGKGEIGPRGFANVLHDRRFVGVPMILETPKGENARGQNLDIVNMKALLRIATSD